MDIKKAAPEGTAISTFDSDNDSKTITIRKNTKQHKIMLALAEGESLNRFEAAKKYHDWCLHSTVSSIQRLGLFIHREFETVPCLYGETTADVCRYSMAPDQRTKAYEILGGAK